MTNNDDLALSMRTVAEEAISEEGATWWSAWQLGHKDGLALHEADANFIATANPANILALLAERDADKKVIAGSVVLFETLRQRIAELEAITAEQDRRLISYAAIATKNAMSVKPAEQYADDSELLFAIDLNDDCESYQTAQWLKELRRRRAAGIKLEVGE